MGDEGPKYHNRISGSKGVMIGDHNVVESMSFHEAPSARESLSDEAAHYAEVGLAHLARRAYGPAAQAFRASIERSPGDALLHYRLALALLANRRPKIVPPAQIAPIEQALEAALQLDPPDGRPALLLAFVRYDHYVLNYRRLRGAGVEELMELAFSSGASEGQLEELRLHTSITTMTEET